MKHRRIEQIIGIGISLVGLTLLINDCAHTQIDQHLKPKYLTIEPVYTLKYVTPFYYKE